jgi:hypothetical protein
MKISFRGLRWLALGLVLGMALGLYLGWSVWPLEITDADPTILQEDYQRDYTLMIADAYWQDDDLAAAQQRLDSVNRQDPAGWLLSLTVDHILSGQDEGESLRLVRLARDLGLYSPAMDPYLPLLEAENVQE